VIDKRIIYPGKVLDTNDPLMLGRIRVQIKIENEIQNEPAEKEKWTNLDPMVCLPLIPYYISQVPKEGEYVHVMFSTRNETKDQNKFYIQGPLTRPWNNPIESYNNSIAMLADGTYIKQAEQIRDTQTGVIQEGLRDVYPLPGDNAVLGRGSGDLLIRPDYVILRSGKYIQSPNTEKPTRNDNRSWVQVSTYGLEKVEEGQTSVDVSKFIDLDVKNFIEWSIDEIDVVTEKVSGYVCTNTVTPSPSIPGSEKVTTASTFEINPLSLSFCNLIQGSKMYFSGFTIDETIKFINNYINGIDNNGLVNPTQYGYTGYTNFPSSGNLVGQFPFVFGPNVNTDNKRLDSDPQISNIVLKIYNKIKLNPVDDQSGFAVVWSRNTVGLQTTTKTEVINKEKYVESPVTYASMGGDFVYLLSHRSKYGDLSGLPDVTNKQKINLTNTLYGINQEKFINDIKPNTSSMVRGEELIALLKEIIQFIKGHVHNINDVPSTITGDGVDISKIEQILNNAQNTILNQNIRIN
jgi:hypothetical protein